MILDLFVILILISFMLVWIGFYVRIPVLSVIGFFFIFLLGGWVVLPNNVKNDSLKFESGVTINNTVSGSVITYDYTSYNDNTAFYVGFLLCIIGIAGMILIPYVNKRNAGVQR